MFNKRAFVSAAATALCFVTVSSASAQSLREHIRGIFSNVLEIQLAGSPGAHGSHFSPSNVSTSAQTIDALSSFISASTGNFTFSSTAAGVTYDLSTGVPVRSTTSLGPIFAERAETLGKNRINVGWNFSFLNQSQIRGVNVEDLRFTFIHEDVGAPGLGDSDNELDTIDLNMNMELSSTVLVFFASYGVTETIDLGIALPFINNELEADPIATMNSFTFLANDSANHFFDGSTDNPVLTAAPTPVKEDAIGIGDVLLRGKWQFRKEKTVDMGVLLDVRIPTGDEDDFLGTGSTAIRPVFILSGHQGDFGPHANFAYTWRSGDLQHDDIEVNLGFDQKMSDSFTLAADLLTRFQVQKTADALDFPEEAYISRPINNGQWSRTVSLASVDNADRDNLYDLSAGFRFAPRPEIMFVGNLIIPLNNDGLRSDLVPTLGIEFTL